MKSISKIDLPHFDHFYTMGNVYNISFYTYSVSIPPIFN